jgi:hypothetical protein
MQERANVLTRRITLEARAQEEADEIRIRGGLAPEPEPKAPRPQERSSRHPALGGPAAASD